MIWRCRDKGAEGVILQSGLTFVLIHGVQHSLTHWAICAPATSCNPEPFTLGLVCISPAVLEANTAVQGLTIVEFDPQIDAMDVYKDSVVLGNNDCPKFQLINIANTK